MSLHALHRFFRLLAAPLLISLALTGAVAPPSDAAVAYRNQTCTNQTFLILGFFSMSKPAGVASGDVMIATMRVSSLLAFNFSTPAGWTEIAAASDSNAKIYYKVAGASEPSSYSFGSMLGIGATMVGTIVAFSGVDTANPIADSAKSTGSGTSVTLPAVTSTRVGSMYYANVTSGATLSSTFTGGTTDACDRGAGGVTIANAYKPLAAGITPVVTDALTSSASWVAQSLILQPSSPCTIGGLTLSTPSSISFPATLLSGANQTVTTTGSLGVSDMTDTAAGWNLSATSTTFTNGSNTLPANATSITGVSVAAGATNCALPATSTTTFPIPLPAGNVAPAATKIYSANIGSGLGISTLLFTFALAVPANARIGTYSSTWTITIASAP